MLLTRIHKISRKDVNSMSKIITIGRQFGSGGRAMGEMIAKKLNIPIYDKELVELAAKKSDVSFEAIKEIDERATNSLLYSVVMGSWGARGINVPLYYEMPLNDKLFVAQSKVIKELAQKGDCIIVGRCADYVLEETEHDVLSVFVYADLDTKIEFAVNNLDVKREKAKETLHKKDKQRRTYYEYYTNKKWGNTSSYDLAINVGKLGLEKAADLVVEAYRG